MSNYSGEASLLYRRAALLLIVGAILVAGALALVYYGLHIPWQAAATQIDVIRANSQRLSTMIGAGVALFFSITSLAKGLRLYRLSQMLLHKRNFL